jgi:hypothetical protein
MTRDVLPKSKWDKKRTSKLGVAGLSNYRKQRNELASTDEITVYREIPFKDWCCHVADAFGHGALAWHTENIGGTVMGNRARDVGPGLGVEDRGVQDLLEV